MISAFLFDFGQTLVDSATGFRSAEKVAEKKVFDHLGLTDWEVFLSSYRRVRKEFHGRSNFSRKDLWAEIYRSFSRQPDLELLEQWEDEYWDQVKAETRPFPETETVLQKLETTFRLGLITNTQGQKKTDTHRLSQFPGLERFFEVIVVAGEGGLAPKPDPRPFHQCLELMGLKPRQAVYVGDDWRIDIRGAEGVGLRPIWLQHHLVRRNWPDVETSVLVINSLDQLLDHELMGPVLGPGQVKKIG
ncbi:MAG: HAD family hydrolase [Thermodesulfobacteriota bacterium]